MRPNLKIEWIVLSSLLLLGMLIGGHWLFQQYAVEKPLMEELSQKVPITQWEMEEIQGKERITFRLGPVENLQQAVAAVQGSLRPRGGSYLVQVKDGATPELERLWQELHLMVYEEMNKGNFAQLNAKVQAQAEEAQAGARVSVDEDFLYIQLIQGENYLYRVLPRHQTSAPSGWIALSGEVAFGD